MFLPARFACATCLVLLSGFAAGQTGRVPEERLYDCKVKDWYPIGTSVQSYRFDYQSGAGDECLVYRIRNRRGEPSVPVRWTYGKRVLLRTKIVAGPLDGPLEPPDWFEVSRTCLGVSKKDTKLYYGLNSDQFEDATAAFVDAPEKSWWTPQKKNGAYQPLGTRIRGRVRDVHGDRKVTLDLSVVTEISQAGTGYSIAFRLTNRGDESIFMSRRVRDNLYVDWEPLSHRRVSDVLRERAIIGVHPREPASWSVTAPLVLGKVGTLKLRRATNDDVVLVEVEAPYYVPAD